MNEANDDTVTRRRRTTTTTATKKRTASRHHLVAVVALLIGVQVPSLWLLRPIIVLDDARYAVDLRAVIRPEVNTTLIQPSSVCPPRNDHEEDGVRSSRQLTKERTASGSDPNLFLLIVVFSSTGNSERRETIRRTWASHEAIVATPLPLPSSSGGRPDVHSKVWPTGSAIKVVFLLGVDHENKEAVASESRRRGDIVQEDFVDTYDNLTLKAVMMLKWVTSSGGGVAPRFLMKTDDDTFVNVPRLVETLLSESDLEAAADDDDDEEEQRDLMVGSVICRGRVVRNIYDKFYVPPSVIGDSFYPDYLSGSGYVMSARLANRLYAVAFRTPFLFLEDVYVTGLCVRQLVAVDGGGAVRVSNDAGFSSSWKQRPMDPCVFHYAITSHHMTADDMERIWTMMNDVSLHVCGPTHLELRNSQRSTCGENWFFDYVNSFL